MGKMEKHVASWFNVEDVPSSYIFPQEYRPGKLPIPICNTIPVIDLGKAIGAEQIHTIQHIMEAAQEFGFFQVVNHGVPEHTISEAMSVLKEFFNMPAAEKASTNPSKNGWVYTGSTGFTKDGFHLWRDNVKLPCHPLEECMQRWPEKPTKYREAVATYLAEIRKLSLTILELISKGLGLEAGYFDELSEVQLLSANNYPPCPDPSLTLGILKHHDPSLITILYQGDVCGLQVCKDGFWIGVGAQPNAFVVNIGNQLEIISNGKLKSAEHRAVTNSSEARTSIATFINPSPSFVVEPAEVLVNEHNPPRYEPTMYKDYVYTSKAFGPDTETFDLAPRRYNFAI